MKIVKIKKLFGLSDSNMFQVIHKRRGHGNAHFGIDVRAIDEMDAYKTAVPLILETELVYWREMLSIFELLNNTFPSSAYTKDVVRAKRMVAKITKDMESNIVR